MLKKKKKKKDTGLLELTSYLGPRQMRKGKPHTGHDHKLPWEGSVAEITEWEGSQCWRRNL